MAGKSKNGTAHHASRRSIADMIDRKEILTADGRRFEDVPMKECAIHYDSRILRGLAIRVMLQAVQDWNKLNSKGRKDVVKTDGIWIWRYEVVQFFNSSFCCNILEAYMPDTDLEAALKNMSMKTFRDRQLGIGRGYYHQKREQDRCSR